MAPYSYILMWPFYLDKIIVDPQSSWRRAGGSQGLLTKWLPGFMENWAARNGFKYQAGADEQPASETTEARVTAFFEEAAEYLIER